MKEKIKRLSHGEFEYELPEIMLFSDADKESPKEEIEFQVETGMVYRGSLKLRNSKKRKMKGILYSDSFFLSIKNPVFESYEAEITYEFDAADFKAGENVKLNLWIVSEFGEKNIPVRVSVTARSCHSSMGDIRDLFHFANLARSDWQEAVKVFKSPEFESVFLFKDIKNTMLYRGLIKSRSTDHALEEFLISIHKKNKVNLYLSESSKKYSELKNITQELVTIRRSQWGYVKINVFSDVDFLVPEYKTIWSESFINDEYQAKFTIDPQKAVPGCQEGNIIFTTDYQILKLHVTVNKEEAKRPAEGENRHIFKKVKAESVKNYLEFRLGNLKLEAYEKRMEQLLSRLKGKNEEWYGIYLRIQMALLTGKREAASQLLLNCDHKFSKSRFGVFPAPEQHILDGGSLTSDIKGDMEVSVEEYCTYIYFKTLFLRDRAVTKRAAEIINEFYGQGYDDSFLLWFLIYLDARYETNPALVIKEVMEHISMGRTSPILYYEALSRYIKQPELLKDLGKENLLIMSFASRHGVLKGELLLQFLHRAGMVKGFSPLLYQILRRLYQTAPNLEVLSVTVQMLIKGHKTDSKYYFWFLDGVKENLNITEIYEYFLASADWEKEPEIPEVVFSYFRYHRNIPRSQKLLFYNYIVKNAAKLPQVYESYASDIREFALEELKAGNANRIMAPMYDRALSGQEITGETFLKLPKLMFLNEIIVKDLDIEGIYVCHRELKGEAYYPLILSQGVKKAIISICTEESCIFLADKQGNRYFETREYTVNKLFDFEKYAAKAAAAGAEDDMLYLYLLEQTQSYHKNILEEPLLYSRLVNIEDLDGEVFRQCNLKLIKYYYDQFAVELLDERLKNIDLSVYSFGERKILMEYMMIRDMLEDSLTAVKTYGIRGLNQKRVMRLLTKILKKNAVKEAFGKNKEDYKFTQLAFLVFSEVQCDRPVLVYLEKHYRGDTKNMLKLWNVVYENGLPACGLGERILSQVLFTEGSDEGIFPVFMDYYKNGDNRRLVKAYLNYSSYRHLVRDQSLEESIFGILEEEVVREPEDVMVLSLLKYYSTKENLSETQIQTANYQISRMIDKNLVLPFFREFKGKLLIPQSIYNKYYVEYRTNPSNNVTIHYCMENGDKAAGYKSAAMKHVYGGIFIKEFLLFYGDELLYYITDDGENGDIITDSTRVRQENLYQDEENQYNLINLMLASRQMQDEKTMLELMESYIRTEYCTKLFCPIED